MILVDIFEIVKISEALRRLHLQINFFLCIEYSGNFSKHTGLRKFTSVKLHIFIIIIITIVICTVGSK